MRPLPLILTASLLFAACHHAPPATKVETPAAAPGVTLAELAAESGDARPLGAWEAAYAIQRPSVGATTLEDLVFVGVDVEMKHLTIRNFSGGKERKFVLLISSTTHTPDGLQISASGEGRQITLGFTGAALVYSAMNSATHALSVRPAQKISIDEAHKLQLGDSI